MPEAAQRSREASTTKVLLGGTDVTVCLDLVSQSTIRNICSCSLFFLTRYRNVCRLRGPLPTLYRQANANGLHHKCHCNRRRFRLNTHTVLANLLAGFNLNAEHFNTKRSLASVATSESAFCRLCDRCRPATVNPRFGPVDPSAKTNFAQVSSVSVQQQEPHRAR